MNSRDRFLAAIQCLPVDRPPIWLMRQAGRYLPEYRELKKKHNFITMVQTPEIAAEVTLQPIERFSLDAAIIFSDILVIPEALGQGYHFRDTGGIGMDYRLDSHKKISALDGNYIAEKLSYVASSISLTRSHIGAEKALIGFSGSPWTLACYMVEGGSCKEFTEIKRLAWNQPEQFESLMNTLTEAIVEYLHLQIDAGADAIQIFDSWAALCPLAHYENWSLSWIRKIINSLDNRVPVILFAKGMTDKAEKLSSTGATALSIDWTVDLNEIRRHIHRKIALQGNLDPAVLTTTPEITRLESRRILDENSNQPGFIFNLGHGMLPNAKIDCVEAMIKEVTREKYA
ncbi:MAG: uroporphyrinogen decarboxylase [Verrucomicrobiota bacterium]|nr:uroporphyrinogen decarboxylase [Verrucomicrobiota bacterium]MEC8650829.1 uroporphyrinogen decarboxylase [Verrucomicrobiota bacterium]